MTRALIVGDVTDSHVQAVLAEIARTGGGVPLLLDAPSLTKLPYAVHDGALTLGDMTVRTDEAGRGWLRRYAPTMWGAGAIAGSLESVRKRAFLTLVGSISRVGNRQWLTTLNSMLAAEDRLYQLDVINRLGYRTPHTVVTSCGGNARSVLGNEFVVKPLANGYYNSADGPQAVFTTALTETDLDQTDFADAPFVAQELIATVEHLRVVTVGGRAWAAALNADGRPMDWRQQDEAHFAWVAVDAPDVCAAALAVAAAFDVGYSSQDWARDTTDRASFLDLNPGGQWLFLPPEVSEPVTNAIAEYLNGRDS